MDVIKRFLLLWILSMAILHASAYDFEVDGIYYNILPEGMSVEVTAGDDPYNEYGDQPNIIIPQEVEYKGEKYTVTGIGATAFYTGKTFSINFESIDLPVTIKKFGGSAFANACFKKVYIHDLTSWCNIINDGGSSSTCLYDSNNPDNVCVLYLNGKPITNLSSLDNRCTQISNYAFYGQRFLENATLPDSVKVIGLYAFTNCKNLKKISIGNKVLNIPERTFTGCKKIKDFIIRDGDNPLIFESSNYFVILNFERDCFFENLYLGRYAYTDKYNHFLWGDISGIKNVICNTKNGINYILFKPYNNANKGLPIKNFIIGPKAKCAIMDLCAKNVYCFGNVNYHQNSGYPDSLLYVLSKEMVPKEFTWEDKIKPLIDIQGFDLQNNAEFEYGDTPDITTSALVSHVPDMQAEINVSKCFGAGKHTEGLPITLSNDIWTAEIYYPWTYTVTKAPLTVIADNMELPYGSEKKDFTVSYFGFKNGEDESVLTKPVTISTTAKTDSPVGTYPIIPFGGYADNYSLSYERGVLTVVKAEQTISWTEELPEEATVGTKIKLEATASSGLPVSFKSSDNSLASITTIGGEYYLNCKNAGDVEITACQAGNKNYENAADEVRSITIKASTGIDDIETGTLTTDKIYDISGNVIKKCQRGVNIIRHSDRTTKKVVVK